jgi:tetratricopeptide (TPR) repeat protein
MGELIGDRRLQTNALTTKGAAYRSLGEDEASLETLEHALMVSPDAFESAWALGLLGYTQLKLGDVIKALTTLEHAVEQADLYRSRQVQSMFRSFLGEAYSQNRQFQQAYHIASQGLQLAEEIQYPGGILRARHTLGRIAYASGDWAEADMHFQGALKSVREHRPSHIQSQLYLDLAILARTQGNFDTAALYLCKAYTAFQKLQIPKYVERTEQLAQEYGVTLVEVELDGLTEGGG